MKHVHLIIALAGFLATPLAPRAAESAPNPASIAFSEGLEHLANGRWDPASAAFAKAQELAPSDARFPLAHAVTLGLGERCQDAVLELARLPNANTGGGRKNREPEFWTYVFETMGGFATAEHRIGGRRFDQSGSELMPNTAVSMPGHMVQGGNDYPTDFASFVYYEMARNGYGAPREWQKQPDPKVTGPLRLQAARWFAARFQASPDLAQAHLERAKRLNAQRQFAASLSEVNFARIPYPADPLLAYYTADAWLGLGRNASARQEATFALTSRTRFSTAYLERAVAAAKLGDAQRARADLEIAVQLDANEAKPYREVIDKALASSLVSGEPLALFAALEQKVQAGQSSTQLVADAAAFHRAAGARRRRYDESYQDRLRQLEAAIAAKPKNVDVKVDLAKYLTDESRPDRRGEAVEPRRALTPYRMRPNERAELDRAIQLCNEAVALDAKSIRALMQKALTLSRLGNDAEAERLVDQVLSFAGKNPEALRLRAKYWVDRANSLALQAASLRVPRSSSSSHTENRSDGVYEVTVTTHYPPSNADLQRADQLDSAAADLYHRADSAINAALNVTKGTFEGELLLADVQFGRRQAGAAEATLREAIRKKPGSLEANEALVDLLVKTGRRDEAELQQSATTQLFHTSAGWTLKQAWKKIVARDFAAARALLESARRLDPADARIPAYQGIMLQADGKADAARIQFRLALALEEGRLALDNPSVWVGAIPPHDAQDFGLAMKLRQLLASDASPEDALRFHDRNAAVAKLLGPGGKATQMFSAMLPEPGAAPIPVPAPVNMATLLADSLVGAGKALQKLGRTTEAQSYFLAATSYGPKAGVPNIGGRTGKREESNFAGQAGGQTAEAFMELAKTAIAKQDFRSAAKYMSQATELRIPRDRLKEANDIQMQIARGMNGR